MLSAAMKVSLSAPTSQQSLAPSLFTCNLLGPPLAANGQSPSPLASPPPPTQGLRDSVYYLVQYVWMVSMYCLFMAIFVLFGSLLGLSIFTQNSYTVQVIKRGEEGWGGGLAYICVCMCGGVGWGVGYSSLKEVSSSPK